MSAFKEGLAGLLRQTVDCTVSRDTSWMVNGNWVSCRHTQLFTFAGSLLLVAVTQLCALHVQVDEQDVQTNLESLLQRRFEQNSQLVTGKLENGLRYVILPNKVPPKRFEAHLEIHAGGS